MYIPIYMKCIERCEDISVSIHTHAHTHTHEVMSHMQMRQYLRDDLESDRDNLKRCLEGRSLGWKLSLEVPAY